MAVMPENPAEEIRRLRRCINDLVSVLALPATWTGSAPSQILGNSLDALVSMLSLDFIYARLRESTGKTFTELVRVGSSWESMPRPEEIGKRLQPWLENEPEKLPIVVRDLFGKNPTTLVPMHLGLHAEMGVIVAGSQRADFPLQAERLVLNIAANQAAIGLQGSSLLTTQRRLSSELDLQVAQRTAELAAAEERWRSVFENSAVGVALTDLNGRFLAANPVYQEMSGYTERELQQLSFLDISHEEDVGASRKLIEELLAGKRKQFQIEKQYRRKNGSLIWVRDNVSVMPGTERVPRFFMALSEDITERKHTEQALLASALNLRRVIDALPTLAWCNLPDGSNEFLNKRWHAYTGLSPEESHGWGWRVAFHSEDLPLLIKRWQELLISGESGEIEARLRRHDGVYRWFLIRVEPLRDEEGKIVRWYGTSTDIEDRKQAQDALQASEHQARLLVDNIPGLVVRMTAAGEVEAVNRRLLEYFGRSLEDVKSWATSGVVHPEDLARAIEIAGHSFATGDPYEMEIRVRRFDGVFRWFQARGLPARDAEGRILHWYALHTDIDDRRQAEEALQARERELDLIVNTIPALAWSARSDGSAEFFNQHYLAYVGLPLEQLQGSGWTIAVHPDDLGRLVAAWQSMIASGKGGEVEGRLRRFDGEYRWFLFRTNPMLGESGKILKWYGTNADIDRRKRAEQQLQRSEAFLAEGQKLSSIGNFSWLVATGEIKWSEQLYRIFEFELGVPVTLELIESRFHPGDLPLMLDRIKKAQRGVSDFEYEYRLLMPDRSIKYVHMIGHRSRDHQGRPEYIGAVQDVTQRRLSEEALGKARSELANISRMTSLGVLTASIAHEVNQPLSGIVTNASTCLRLLSADPPNVESARETARRAIRDGNRAAEVITRLRSLFVRKNATFELFDLNEAAKEVVALSLNDLERNRVILRWNLAIDLPSVSGDRTQIQQVILNLVRNGSDAMNEVDDRPREMLVKTESDESAVHLSVKDTGVGFASQAQEKLFEAFYTTKGDGMGIGLSISRSIMESHRGRLWAVRNQGPGATFTFSIPRGTNT